MTPSQRVSAVFVEQFEQQPDLLVRAPGRVNLIGEHTDYNDGFVLPCAIDYETCVAIGLRNDSQVQVIAADYDNQRDLFDLNQPIEHHPSQRWSDYVRGVVKYLQERGQALHGLNLVVSGNVPMDQMISASGKQDHALLLDCRSLETRLIPMPSDLAVLIVNSNVRRGLVDSEYNTRRQQCETAARHYGVKALRDLDLAALEAGKAGLDEVCYRRARHVVGDNTRTLAAADALESGDLVRLGQLMAESHAAMRDDFEITVPPIDGLVEIIKTKLGREGGVRMTGGGFGGCVVALLRPAQVAEVIAAVDAEYPARFGIKADSYVCRASAGAGKL